MTLLFLCGPHGAGKTTLEKRLAQAIPEILVADLKTKTPKFHTTPYERLMLKHAGRAVENYEASEIAKENSERLVLANRCKYDSEAYTQAFSSIGWITQRQYENSLDAIDLLFTDDQCAIVLNPPFPTVWQRLQKRWKSEEKKWNEGDEAYCRAACEAYRRYKNRKGIIYLEDNAVDDLLISKVREYNPLLCAGR